MVRHASQAGTDGRCAATLRRPAQRPAVIIAETQRRHAGGQGGSFATAGATRRARGVPRVASGPAQGVVRVPAQTKIGEIGPGIIEKYPIYPDFAKVREELAQQQ